MQIYENILEQTIHGISKKIKFFILIILTGYSASGFAQQDPNVLIKANNPTIAQAFKSIESQTGLRFTWDQLLDVSRVVDLPQKPTPLSKIMGIILKGTDRSYAISANFILIKLPATPKEVATTEVAKLAPRPAAIPKLQGQVVDASRKSPIAGVTIKASGELNFETTTNQMGEFNFDPIPEGEYTFRTFHRDYSTSVFVVFVSNRRANNVNFKMYPKSTANVQKLSETVKLSDVTPNWVYTNPSNKVPKMSTPKIAIKTNLLYDAQSNINLGFEVRLSDRLTLDVPVNYNPWVFSGNKRFNNILVQPELRMWLDKPFSKHFVGVHTHFAHYNIANRSLPFGVDENWKNSRYQGDLYGFGLSYGYQWTLSQKFKVEATLGLGYFYANYERFDCQICGLGFGREQKNYFGPTKAGLSVVYILNK